MHFKILEYRDKSKFLIFTRLLALEAFDGLTGDLLKIEIGFLTRHPRVAIMEIGDVKSNYN